MILGMKHKKKAVLFFVHTDNTSSESFVIINPSLCNIAKISKNLTPWHDILRLRMEEGTPIWKVALNILHK
jgi:hypothetical protein